MRHMKPILLLVTATVLAMGNAVAQDDPPRHPREMTSEEREAARASRREQWENMSDEERAAAREQHKQRMHERRQAMRERYENMSEEERQAMRERRAKREGARPGKRGHEKRGESSPESDGAND